jgi:hypothetical protein
MAGVDRPRLLVEPVVTGRGRSMVMIRRTSISTPRKMKPKKSAEYSLGESRPIKGMYAMV